MRVLVVDDAPDIRRVLAILFGLDGHEVVEAENGVRALEVLDAQEVDAIVTDFRMPAMDGMELLREIERRGRPTRRVMLTAYPSAELAKEAQGLHAKFLTKPFDVDALRAAIA